VKLSIIIPVLNSHEVVRRQLLHFFRIGLPGDTELILVDDGSDPPIENDFSNLARIHRTNDKRPWTWALARNAGARLATGDYLLMYDLDHIADRKLLDFVRGFTGLKVQFTREFGILDEFGRLTQDRDVLAEYGLPKHSSLKLGPLPNNFAMRRDLFWELGGYREDLVEKPYPQGEDRAFRSAWRTHELKHGGEGSMVCPYRPKMFMFPNGKYLGDVDADPKGLFHKLTRKTSRNFWHQQQRKERVES
jgi:glycosyltransferase involved in cell wall biosynthesis